MLSCLVLLHVCMLLPSLPGDGAVPVPLPLYLLGLDIQERWTFAVDITAARDLFMVRSWTLMLTSQAAAGSHMLAD